MFAPARLKVVEELIRCNPFSYTSKMTVEVSEAESSSVVIQEATSQMVTMQHIAHEEWLRVPHLVKGRVELQIKCIRPDMKTFILGETERSWCTNASC